MFLEIVFNKHNFSSKGKNSHSQMFFKIYVLKNFAILTETFVLECNLIKLPAFRPVILL